MDLERLSFSGQFLVFLVMGLILLVIFYFAFYSGKAKTIEDTALRIEDLDQQIRRAEKSEKKLDQIREEKRYKESQLEELKKILPEKQEVDKTLRKIQEQIYSSRLRLNNFTPGNPVPKEIYDEWPIPMKVEGNYHNLAIFFDILSKMTTIYTIENLVIRPLTSMSEEFTISADFTATTYLYKEPPPPAKPVPRQRPAAVQQRDSSEDRLDV